MIPLVLISTRRTCWSSRSPRPGVAAVAERDYDDDDDDGKMEQRAKAEGRGPAVFIDLVTSGEGGGKRASVALQSIDSQGAARSRAK